jgi:hypothetical protein
MLPDNGPWTPRRPRRTMATVGIVSTFLIWLRGDDERTRDRVADPDRVVEVAWLPLWQVHLVMPRLLDGGIPATFSEDHTSHLRFAAMQPMGRIFVMEPRLEQAYEMIRELTGEDPPRQGDPGPPRFPRQPTGD